MISRDKGFDSVPDYSNQLIEVKKKGRIVGNYFYNSGGKRYKKTENSKDNYYAYSGENMLYEESADGTVKIYYVYLNGKQIAKVENRNGVVKKYYYFTDHLGSTRVVIDGSGKAVGSVDYEPFGDEKPYFPNETVSLNESNLESTNDLAGRNPGTKSLSTDRVEGNYSVHSKIEDDPYDYSSFFLSNRGTMDTEESRYYYMWVKPLVGAEWIKIVYTDPDDLNRSAEFLVADDGSNTFFVGSDLKANQWNLIILDAREGQIDGIDKNTTYSYWHTDEFSEWQWDNFGISQKDPVTYTGKRQDDSTGLYYFNARYYDPELGRFITEDPVRDGANWYVYCDNHPLNYVDLNGLYPFSVTGNNLEKRQAVFWLGYVGAAEAKLIADQRLNAAMTYAIRNGMKSAADNEADAYRHFTWNVEMTRAFSKSLAKRVADNHEIFGEGGFGGTLSSKMDLWNNYVGREMATYFKNSSIDDIWSLAKNMSLVVLNPHNTNLVDWDFSSAADIPKWAIDFLNYAKEQNWSAQDALDELNQLVN